MLSQDPFPSYTDPALVASCHTSDVAVSGGKRVRGQCHRLYHNRRLRSRASSKIKHLLRAALLHLRLQTRFHTR